MLGGIDWRDADRVHKMIEHDRALGRMMMVHHEGRHGAVLPVMDNPDFKRWFGGVVSKAAYEGAEAA